MWQSRELLLGLLLAALIAAMPGPAVADSVVRAEWIGGDCPKGLPPAAKEAPQKFAGLLVAVAAVILRFLCLVSTKIVFVESVCRVESLSLTGKILLHARIADDIHVQWKQLAWVQLK